MPLLGTLSFGDILVYVTVFFGIFTSIFFLLTLFLHEERMRPKKKVPLEKVCIIVPCYNEETTVAKTLESLLALDYPRRLLEIVVVDDGSTDNTFAIASRYAKRGVIVYRKKNGGKFTALNYALKRTDAVYVGALDADSFVDPHALTRILPYFSNPKVMAVTPSMKVHNPKNWLQKVQWTEFLLGIFLRKIFAFLGSIHVTPGPFSIYRTAFFRTHGLYKHAHNTEDIEMALRIQAHDYEIENAHDAYVYTVGPDTLKGLWNQRIRWYHGFLRNTEDYRRLFGTSHGTLGMFILPASFLSVWLVIVSIAYICYKSVTQTIDRFVYLRATGYDFFQWNWNFDTFFININSVAILGFISVLFGIIVILVAKYIAGERKNILVNYLWFLATYWLFFGVWWLAAIWMRISGTRIGWRHKSED
jgi:cellulose synthase/poly-beta-1,6-N-acetylglucosamine synthase-like glycosyltransferase